jgi:hypothetical protein
MKVFEYIPRGEVQKVTWNNAGPFTVNLPLNSAFSTYEYDDISRPIRTTNAVGEKFERKLNAMDQVLETKRITGGINSDAKRALDILAELNDFMHKENNYSDREKN